MNNYYTYAYLREDRTPYYIGKGKGKRVYYKKKSEGLKVPKDKNRIIFLKKNLTEVEAFKHEIYMIAVFGRKDLGTGILWNRTNGGDGTSGRCWTEEMRQKISLVHKGKPVSDKVKQRLSELNKGKKISQETKQKISNTLKGRILSEEQRRKISKIRTGTTLSEETKQKIRLATLNRSQEVIERMRHTKCKKQYELIDKEGKIYYTNNIKSFSIEHNLNHSALYRLINQKIDYYKGWNCRVI